MKREEIKEFLRKKGVREELLEMPAVIEPIYKNFMEIPAEHIENLLVITVSEDGNFKYNHYLDINAMGKSTEKNIYLNEDGSATINCLDITIGVNKYGIEETYSDGNWMDLFSNITRSNGIITEEYGNNGNATLNRYSNFDNGSWSILQAKGLKVPTYTSKEDLKQNLTKMMIDKNISKETILSEFDRNSATIISAYPKTAEWYALVREQLEQTIPDRVSKEEYSRLKIISLEKQVADLTKLSTNLSKENSTLKAKNSKLTMMLEKALGFIEKVKNSPVGQLFFGKKIKEFEQDKGKLDVGKEEK